MVVDLDADSISEWDGGPLTQFVAPLPQVDAVLSVAAQGMEFAGAAEMSTLEFVRDGLIKIESLVPSTLMVKEWERSQRWEWLATVHAAKTGRDLARCMLALEMAMFNQVMISPWRTAVGLLDDSHVVESTADQTGKMFTYYNCKKKRKYATGESSRRPGPRASRAAPARGR